MKKILKLTFIILLFTLIAFSNISFANEIIYINSVEDYQRFAINAEYFDGYENKTIVLNTDLDFQNETVPIVSGKFKGVFDGQGYSFKNIKLEPGKDFRFELGLFEENWGLIKKVVVESGSITGEHTTGAICGKNSGVVEQCANFVNINSEFVIGGIVGWNEGQGIVRNCYNVGNITDLEPGSGGTIGFGGIVGFLYSGTILDCYNVGIIAPERDNHCKGNIVGTYYTENSDREFIDRCFSLMINSQNINDTEKIYCLQLLDFNEEFYSNLSLKNSFIQIDSQYPHINMHINLDELPPLVTLPSNFEINPFFENYYKKNNSKVTYEQNIKSTTDYKNSTIYSNLEFDLENETILEYNEDGTLKQEYLLEKNNDPTSNIDNYVPKDTNKIEKETSSITSFINYLDNLDKKISDFFNTFSSFSIGNLALIFVVFISAICTIIFKANYKNKKSSDGLNDNSDDSNYL